MSVDASRDLLDTGPALGWRALLVIALAVVVTFFTVTDGAFVADDLTLIARNPTLQHPGGLLEIVGQPMWSALPEFKDGAQVGHWRPLTSLVFAGGYALGGSADAPFVFHALSLLFHVLAAFAAFALARRLLRHDLAALGVALLFALHPLQTESVAWISALNDPLGAALLFAGLERWLAWRERAAGLPWAASGLYLLALLTKESSIAFLPLVVLLELTGFGARAKRWSGFGLVVGATLVWYALRIWVFGEAAAGFFRVNASYGDLTLRLRGELLGGGVARTLWPVDLAPGEPFREVWPAGSGDKLAKTLGLAAFACAALAAGVHWARKRTSLVALATFGFLAALLPALLAPSALGQTPFAARYLYVPVFFAVLGLAALVRNRRALFGVLAVLALLGAWRVQGHAQTWASPTAYYERVTERYPDAPSGFWNLGETLRGRYIASTNAADGSQGIGNLELLERAFAAYEAASALLERAASDATIPKDELDYLRTGIGQAWSYLLQAEVDEFRDYDTPRQVLEMLLERVMQREAANRAQGYPRPPLPVEEVFNTLGIVKLRAGDKSGAADEFRRALELRPNYVPALRNLGLVRLEAGDAALATQLFQKALNLVPGDPEVLEPYARSLFEEGWVEQALLVADELEAADPASPTPEQLRGLDALQKRDFRSALEHFDKALSANPRAPGPLYHRGMTLEQLGERDEAVTALRRAAEADPTHFPAHYNLARMLLEVGATPAAKPYLERAYVLGNGRAELVPMRQVLLQLDPENAPRMREFADVDDQRRDAEGALFWTERALAVDPENGRSRHLLGRMLMEQDEHVLALPELIRASELLPKAYIVFEDLGRCYAQLGRYPESREAYERAIALIEAQTYAGNPDDPPQVKQAWQQVKQNAINAIAKRLTELPKGR